MKYLYFYSIFFSFGEPATKDDIKSLIEFMKNNQEQTNKRFDFIQSLIYILVGLVFTPPFTAIYLKSKENSKIREMF